MTPPHTRPGATPGAGHRHACARYGAVVGTLTSRSRIPADAAPSASSVADGAVEADERRPEADRLVFRVGHNGSHLYLHLFGGLHSDSHIVIAAEVVLYGGIERVACHLQRLKRGDTR